MEIWIFTGGRVLCVSFGVKSEILPFHQNFNTISLHILEFICQFWHVYHSTTKVSLSNRKVQGLSQRFWNISAETWDPGANLYNLVISGEHVMYFLKSRDKFVKLSVIWRAWYVLFKIQRQICKISDIWRARYALFIIQRQICKTKWYLASMISTF